jgi:RNA polymerase sigma factor (sigma-70 family)
MNTCIAETHPFHQFDADYLRELRNGSSETLEHFVEYFSAILARRLRKYRMSPGSIDDICQETLVRVLARLNSEQGLRSPECLGAFVVSVGKNVHREFCRTVKRAGEAFPSEDRFYDTAPDPERRVLNGEVRQQIQQTLNRLSPIDRQILVMALAEGHPRLAICRTLNVKPAYLPVLLHRAKGRFRNMFTSESAPSNRHSAVVGSHGSAQGATS